MSDDWDKPITKPLPGPVASEAMQMSPIELMHVAKQHPGPLNGCSQCGVAR